MRIRELIGELIEEDIDEEIYVQINTKSGLIFVRIEGIAAYLADAYIATDGTSKPTLLLEMDALTLVDP